MSARAVCQTVRRHTRTLHTGKGASCTPGKFQMFLYFLGMAVDLGLKMARLSLRATDTRGKEALCHRAQTNPTSLNTLAPRYPLLSWLYISQSQRSRAAYLESLGATLSSIAIVRGTMLRCLAGTVIDSTPCS